MQCNSLHVVERVKQGRNEARRHFEEARQLLPHGIVVVLVIGRGRFKLLLQLEQVLLILQRLFLLLAQLTEGVVDAIVVNQLRLEMRARRRSDQCA